LQLLALGSNASGLGAFGCCKQSVLDGSAISNQDFIPSSQSSSSLLSITHRRVLIHEVTELDHLVDYKNLWVATVTALAAAALCGRM
jgi:hypothetical protein